MVYSKKGLLFLLALIVLACTKTEPLEDNPLDPGGGEYEIPSVAIMSDIQPGQTITNETISIVLEGNELVVEYRIKLDDLDWTEWTSDNSFTVTYLDEGEHTIYAQSRYISTDESEIISIDFNVDAVSGPAIMFFPRRHYANAGDQIIFTINAEEVTDLAGIEFMLGYDPEQLSVVSITSGNIFSQSDDPIFLSELDTDNHSLTITTATWGSGNNSFTGTGSIAQLEFQVLQSAEIDIVFDGEVVYRDNNNTDIDVSEIIPGKIFSY